MDYEQRLMKKFAEAAEVAMDGSLQILKAYADGTAELNWREFNSAVSLVLYNLNIVTDMLRSDSFRKAITAEE